ncbi:MAG: tetratricopeptide repeat protein [Clostridia bacterium]|nr:tetratricopeptide repeat protein [Clostridia bacterium]
MDDILNKEDYQEPRCVICDTAEDREPASKIPMQRIVAKLDEYIEARDVRGAERLLAYWTGEAEEQGDLGGLLSLYNEKMGLMRNNARYEEAKAAAEAALDILKRQDFSEDPVSGTTYLNAATVCNAAGEYDAAAEYYELARQNYERLLEPSDPRMGGLYNNMGVNLGRVGRFDEAFDAFQKALEIMKDTRYEDLERAVTCINVANLYELLSGTVDGEAKINEWLQKASELLDKNTVKAPYAAYVYNKCAPAFLYYGWFAYADELNERAERIYEGT